MGEDVGSSGLDAKKSHREPHSGRKAERKKRKRNADHDQELSDRQRNPKAFGFNSAVKAERRFRHRQDVETKKQHVPLVDRNPVEPPPILVAVVGPPKVGKSTVIGNLIRLFTRSPLTDVRGPVTVVTGKKRRITLIECNNDIGSMIDLAKVADLVLLLCDASFGFEMEVFEFLNICQVHGMPRIMGVLTHLDLVKNSKQLKNVKKTLKHRFWTEVYPGAKLFYLSGILHGEYLRNEIKNLGRFISIIKFRPLTWRTQHSYLLGDRYEDLTNLELVRRDPKVDRNVSLYGYVRGVPLGRAASVHIAGLGDVKIHDVSFLPDPCPLPEAMKKRALVEREKLIYAPFSGVGGIVYDKDAVYVELGGSHSHARRDGGNEASDIVSNLIEAKQTLDAKLRRSELKLFTGSEAITADDEISAGGSEQASSKRPRTKDDGVKVDEDDLDEELSRLRRSELVEDDSGRIRRKVVFDDEGEGGGYTTLKTNKDSEVSGKIADVLNRLEQRVETEDDDDSDEEEGNDVDDDEESDGNSGESVEESESESGEEGDLAVKWKENLAVKAQNAFLDRRNTKQNLMKLVYGVFDKYNRPAEEAAEPEAGAEGGPEIGGLFKLISHDQRRLQVDRDTMNLADSSLIEPWTVAAKDWLEPENKSLIQNCFVTGKWKESEDAEELLKLDDAESDAGSEVFGDFEDLETGEKHESAQPAAVDPSKEQLAAKKQRLKEKFDAEYDGGDNKTDYYDDLKASAEKQSQLNKSVFENLPDDLRVQIEGYRPGMYVRIELRDVPAEFVEHFDPTYPLVVGSLNRGEENVGYVSVKVKKHRWHKKILKTGDPVVVSMGWRRFQTVPVYSKLQDDLKYRYLKYTPEHVTCNAHFWGPVTPQSTGFLAFQTGDETTAADTKKRGFRIAATGAVQELDKSTQIMKKLKLIGYPFKIYKKTAFIKGMFNTALEVAKFEGARVKTVSGIRGQIKKALSKPEGCFRATFEDKVKLSDIVFCRTWYRVQVEQFYNPVVTLLLPPSEKNAWRGLRTLGELKRAHQIRNAPATDSLYTDIVREERPFKPLVVPRKLQAALPYRDKPKFPALNAKERPQRVAVVREPHEQKVSDMLKMLRGSFEHKQERLKAETKQRLAGHRKEIRGVVANKEQKLRERKKHVMRMRSKAKARESKKEKRNALD